MRRRAALGVVVAALLLLGSAGVGAERSFVVPKPAELASAVAALTALEMEGRRSGTEGGERAAELIAGWLRAAGAQPAGDAGSFFQSFVISMGTRLAAGNALDLIGVGPSAVVGREWIPHGGSADGEVDGEVAFVGYGISARDQGHDDYAGVDVTGRIVLALSGAPARLGRSVPRVEKLVAARERGARAFLLVEDTLPELGTTVAASPLLSASVRTEVADRLLAPGGSVGTPVAQPRSFATGKRIRLRVALKRAEIRGVNVLGLVPGHDPTLADETVVVGAHYDHLGRVGGAVHPGADDNASGTALVVSLARAFATAGGTPRTLVFALFGAEEIGLLGSGHYVRHPVRPLARTVGMVNFDMVGRLRDEQLTVGGTDSAAGLRETVMAAANAEALKSTFSASPFGPSDHASFYRAGVPVLFFHTGTHEDYHRPTDTADKLDVAGMARIAAVGAHIVARLAAAPRPVYAAVPAAARSRQRGSHAFLGVRGDVEPDGARLVALVPGAAADRAGLREGDVLIRLGGSPVASFEDLRAALRARRGGERIDVVFIRNGEQRSVTATLD